MTDTKKCESSKQKPEEKKLKPCCACPETKRARDECIVENGEEKCGALIEAHKKCMRDAGFNTLMLAAKKNDRKLDLLLIQNCEQEITKLDIDVKKQITDLLNLDKATTQQQLTAYTREIKTGISKLEEKIAQLERLAGKWNFRGEDGEALREELNCHRDELVKNREHLRVNSLRASKTIDEQSRRSLFEQNTEDVELRRRAKNRDDMVQKSNRTTDSLSKLVSQMGEQLKLSEETTTTLIHSSHMLQDTEQQFTTMGSTIKSGGKLLSKYGRRECTDKILIVLALLFYFGVVVLIRMTSEELNELNEYLRENKSDEARRMINKNPDLLKKKDDSGRTCIHWAASGGCLPLVQYAASLNSEDAVASDDMGYTPLMIAAAAGRVDVVRYLMSIPIVCINSINNNGQCSLHYAASKGHEVVVKMLLEAGPNVNVQDRYGATPLHRAAAQNRRSIIRMLTAVKGIRVNIKDGEGNTPLHLACQDYCEDAMFDLVNAGADLDVRNKDEKKPLEYVQSDELVQKLKKLATKHA